MIVRFTEAERCSIELRFVPPGRTHAAEYLAAREAAWEARLARVTAAGGKLWNGEIYTLERLAQTHVDDGVVLTLGTCEYKDIVLRVELGGAAFVEKFGEAAQAPFLMVSCVPVTRDERFVFGVRGKGTIAPEGALGLIGGTLNRDEAEVARMTDVDAFMLREIAEETRLEPVAGSLRLQALNGYLGNFELLYTCRVELTAAEIARGHRAGEFTRLVAMAADEVATFDGAALGAFRHLRHCVRELSA